MIGPWILEGAQNSTCIQEEKKLLAPQKNWV